MFAPLIHFYPGLAEPPAVSATPVTAAAHSCAASCAAFTRCPGPPHFDSRSIGLATSSLPDVHLILDPKRQRWAQLPDGHWLGVQTDPTPDPSLWLRPDALPGIPVTLGDRQLWILPRVNPAVPHDLPTQRRLATLHPARPASGGVIAAPHPVTAAPHPVTAAPHSCGAPPAPAPAPLLRAHVILEILPAFSPIATEARRLADLAVGAVLLEHATALSIPDPELSAFLCSVIALNYALTPDEILALGLLSPATDAAALLSVISFPGALAAAALPPTAAPACPSPSRVPRDFPAPIPSEVPHG
jgi:hypothetical protein